MSVVWKNKVSIFAIVATIGKLNLSIINAREAIKNRNVFLFCAVYTKYSLYIIVLAEHKLLASLLFHVSTCETNIPELKQQQREWV